MALQRLSRRVPSWLPHAGRRYMATKEKDPQLGDYPDLPFIHQQSLPAKGWWDMQNRRNFGDPIHEQDQLLSMWGPDKPFMEPSKALRHLSMYFAGLIAFGVTVKYALIPERLAVPREFPFDGLVKELGGIEANKQRAESLEEEDGDYIA